MPFRVYIDFYVKLVFMRHGKGWNVMKSKNLLFVMIGLGLAVNAPGGNMPEIIEDDEGEPEGIKLNFPQELIDNCRDKYWALQSEESEREVENILSSQESFNAWSREQTKINNTL